MWVTKLNIYFFKYVLLLDADCVVSTQIKYRQTYEQEIKGKASAEAAAAEVVHARENAENFSQVGTCVYAQYLTNLWIKLGEGNHWLYIYNWLLFGPYSIEDGCHSRLTLKLIQIHV